MTGEPGDPASGDVASSTAAPLTKASGLYRPLQATKRPRERCFAGSGPAELLGGDNVDGALDYGSIWGSESLRRNESTNLR